MNKELTEFIETYLNQDLELPARTKDVNARYIKYLGYSLAELAFRCKGSNIAPTEQALPTPSKKEFINQILVLDFDLPIPIDFTLIVYQFIAKRQAIYDNARERDEVRRDRQKTRYNTSITGQTFYPG